MRLLLKKKKSKHTKNQRRKRIKCTISPQMMSNFLLLKAHKNLLHVQGEHNIK